MARYQSRLLAFCRHMLSSREDAEDVLQEVFAAAFNAMLADDREINVRPWLYRIARNRSLNHLRRTQAVGVDSMDIHLSEGGLTTADKVHKREEFRLLIADVQDLPETQRTALLLREIDALSYEQIAEAMETTVPSVKSLLVRARVSLAEAAEARLLSCDEVRIELGEVAEGLKRTTAPVRRHLRTCDRCTDFRKYLRSNNKALAALFPIGPLLLFKKLLVTHIGTTAAASSTGAAAAGAGTAERGRRAAGRLRHGRVQAGRGPGRRRDRHRRRRRGPARDHEARRREDRRREGRAEEGRCRAAPPPRLPRRSPSPPCRSRSRPRPSARSRRSVPTAKKDKAEPKATATATASATPDASATPAATGTATPPAAGAPAAEGRGGDTTALPTDTQGTAEPGSGTFTPPASQPTPPPATGPEFAVVPTPPAPQPDPTPSATPEQPATPEAPPAPVATPAPQVESTPSPSQAPVEETPAP